MLRKIFLPREIAVDQGGTGLAAYAVGDLIFASGATTLAKLADVAAGNALISGGIGVAPSWGKISLTSHISGILPIANGGTNSNAVLNNNRIMISSGDAIVENAALTDGQLLIGATGAAPVAATLTGTANEIAITNAANSITLGINRAATLAANPTFAANSYGFGTTGFVFEGATADVSEGLLTAADPSADRTWTLPNASGTLALSNGALTTDNVPRWDGSQFINSNMWCNTNAGVTKIYLGSVAAPGSYTYDLEIAGSFKTTKIYHASDARWKTNINTINNALDAVLSMRGVTYEWKKDEFKDKNFSSGTQIGLIAQEVEKVLPELVNTGADGYKAVEYANIVAVLIEAIKEQQKQISAQNTEIQQLKADNKNINAQFEQINNLQKQMETMQTQIVSLNYLLQNINANAVK
ncbi:MAG: tail fiber domain-containing protein [Bacteroidales bacterium]|nr:tail fiber domain-containing protein [Bacteroidales bacterium]